MSQINSISYPKIHQRKDGKVEVIVYYKGKRMRLQNGNSFGILHRPNSFPKWERVNQAKILASQIYSKLLAGYSPLSKKRTELEKGKPHLYYMREALNLKLKQEISKHHANGLLLAYRLIEEHARHGLVTTSTISSALDRYKNNTSYNTMKRNMNTICRFAVSLGLDRNPVDGIMRKKEKAKLHKPILELTSLLKEIHQYNENLYLCCLLTYGCLLRPHREVRELKWGDFTEDLCYIRLSGSRNKSLRNRIVPVPYYIKEVLKKNENHRNIFSSKEEPFAPDYFKGLWSHFKKRSKLIKENQTLYSFRHTGAIDIYKRTGSIEKLKAAMGHSNIMVSLTYLRGLDVAELKEEDMPVL